jgi:hypothetical protein
MSLGPIPRSQLRRYADELELVGDLHDRFCKIISLVDVGYLLMLSNSPKSPPPREEKLRNVVTLDNKAGVIRLLNRVAKKPDARP